MIPPHANIGFLSEAAKYLTGHDPEEFTRGAVSWRDMVHPDDRAAID